MRQYATSQNLERASRLLLRELNAHGYVFAVKFRVYKKTDLTISEIVSFVAALGACLSGAEAGVAFSIAT